MAINDQWLFNQIKAAEGVQAYGNYGYQGQPLYGAVTLSYGAQGMGYVPPPPPAPFGSPIQPDPQFLNCLEGKLIKLIVDATGDQGWEKYRIAHSDLSHEFAIFHPEQGELFRIGETPVLQAMKTGKTVALSDIRWTRSELKPEAEPEEPLEPDPFELRTW